MCACTKPNLYVQLLKSAVHTVSTSYMYKCICMHPCLFFVDCHSIPFSCTRSMLVYFTRFVGLYSSTRSVSFNTHIHTFTCSLTRSLARSLAQYKWLIVPCAVCFATLSSLRNTVAAAARDREREKE